MYLESLLTANAISGLVQYIQLSIILAYSSTFDRPIAGDLSNALLQICWNG